VIDQDKVKSFWDARAKTYENLAFESIANLEQDSENLQLKIQLETEKVGQFLGSVSGMSVLDLGAGVGQWAFRFAEAGARRVTAVEYSEPLAEIGRAEAERRNLGNVSFVVSSAENYASPVAYDLVFISGLFVYMNDDQAERLVSNLKGFCHDQTLVLLRDGTALASRHEINDRMSDHLQSRYSATYRTRQEYTDLFGQHGFVLQKDENMFDEGCPLNKYPETRLRIYRFARGVACQE
jgi:SAM-dependent methyltransferase